MPLTLDEKFTIRPPSRSRRAASRSVLKVPLRFGALVEILDDFPPAPLPIYVLYSHTRQLSPRLRVFIEWMAKQLWREQSHFAVCSRVRSMSQPRRW
jgi:hypothetical protein